MALDLEVVADNLGFPEGPVAMKDGSLLFVDIEKQTLSRADAGGKVDVVAEMSGGPNGVAIGPDGAAYVCNNGGIYTFSEIPVPGGTANVPTPLRPNYHGGLIQRVDLKSGEVTVLYDSYRGNSLLAPDDIVFDRSGGFWFTDSGYEDGETLHKGALYYATTDGRSLMRVATIPMANGVGLSPEGKTVYVSDTIFGRLWALDIAGPGRVKPMPLPVLPGRVVQTLPSFELLGSPSFQWLDSLKVEESGKVCVGTIFNGGITVFDPVDGSTKHVPVPSLFTTNLCFGGADMMDVWITASSSRQIFKTRWPRPGLKLAFYA